MIGEEELLDAYERMRLMRAFEEACASGVRDGHLRGELHLATGHEGVGAALERELRDGDWVVATHRSHLAAIAAGVPLEPLMAEIFERASGLGGGKGGHLHLFDAERRFSTTGIVGASLPVALGHAYALRLAGEPHLSVGITGEGGTNAGQFFETLNMAALWRLPLLVLVEDNGWGISVSKEASVAPPGIAARAASFGIPAFEADATRVELAAPVFAEAFARVRAGGGPALLIARCHRFAGHYEGDPDLYRGDAEKARMREQGDPILNLRRALREASVPEERLDEARRRAEDRVSAIHRAVLGEAPPDPRDALSDVFAPVSTAEEVPA